MKKLLYSLPVLIFFTLFTASSAFAACANPAGNEGDMVYNEDHLILQYCNAANQWIPTMDRPAASGGDCTSPTGAEGAVIYSQSQNVHQICIGQWHPLGPLNPAAAGGGCSLPSKSEGAIIYNDDDDIMQYCNGSAWVKLRGPAPQDCPDIGDTCVDGSVYAGLTPDRDVRFYVPRCDIGQTFDGTNCTGTATLIPWNNGNTSGYTETHYNSTNSGTFNTAGLLHIDADSGVAGIQPHQAAHACADLDVHGRTDWYLPAIAEMSVIYENLQDGTPNDNSPDPLINGISTGTYHSSKESETIAQNHYISMSGGTTGQYSAPAAKYLTRPVRCARKD